MNFVKNLKDIQTKLFRDDKYGGCYVYSRLANDDSYKLGMSEVNLFGRVKNAKSCFPNTDEFFIHFYIICHDISNIRKLEKKLLVESQSLQKNKITKDGIPEQGIRPTEYRLTTDRNSLGEAVRIVLNENLTLWDNVIVFGPSGWNVKVKSIRNLPVSTSKTMHGIEYQPPFKVGDTAYVLYKSNDKIVVSKGKIIEKLTRKRKFRLKFEGYSETYDYPYNEIYKLKKQANFAKQYWYEELV
jgi:hypothetical protein